MPDSSDVTEARPRRLLIGAVALTRLSELMGDVIADFDGRRANIELVKLGFEDAVRYLRRRGGQPPFDVLVSAGSNGAYLKARAELPVVLVRPSGFDLMQALTRARQRSERIGVITHASDMTTFSDFRRAFNLPIAQRAFVTAEDARQCVSELVGQGVEVIVGTGLITELSEQAGIAGILQYSAESVRAAFEQALDLGTLLRARSGDAGPVAPLRTRRSTSRPKDTDFSGTSRAARAVRQQVARCAASEATVLILGETGSGKERVARALHTQSPRASGPFVAINCGALSESLLEAELFGHEEGAFTGARRGGRPGLIEAAHRGTLLLDEIGEMPSPLQTRLLRVLEEREVLRVGGIRPQPVDLRVIAATHRDLEADLLSGRFRRDLYYRLNVLRLNLPPLRSRPDDLPLLIKQLQPGLQFTPQALQRLSAYAWPGNVRELRNLLERCRTLSSDTNPIEMTDLLAWVPELEQTTPPGMTTLAPPDLPALLAAHGGDRQALARALGISRSTLWRRLRQLAETPQGGTG
jgi:transcriptional regulator, propionate catabolism operon regulatory protein